MTPWIIISGISSRSSTTLFRLHRQQVVRYGHHPSVAPRRRGHCPSPMHASDGKRAASFSPQRNSLSMVGGRCFGYGPHRPGRSSNVRSPPMTIRASPRLPPWRSRRRHRDSTPPSAPAAWPNRNRWRRSKVRCPAVEKTNVWKKTVERKSGAPLAWRWRPAKATGATETKETIPTTTHVFR
jgi:hypothetical protein